MTPRICPGTVPSLRHCPWSPLEYIRSGGVKGAFEQENVSSAGGLTQATSATGVTVIFCVWVMGVTISQGSRNSHTNWYTPPHMEASPTNIGVTVPSNKQGPVPPLEYIKSGAVSGNS